MDSTSSFLNLENYTVIEKIGEGSFGLVYKVKENSTGNFYAAKITKQEIIDSNKDSSYGKSLYSEINLISKFNHPSILQFIGYSPINFKKEPYPTIVSQLAENGTLRHVINLANKGTSPEGWDFTKKLINIYGIASGMQYLHKNDIIHRDLKPENIFLDESYFPLIADFGLSKITNSSTMSISLHSENCPKGTCIYFPPEIVTGKTKTNTKAGDVYAFAIITYEILTETNPFRDFTYFELLNKISNGYRPEIQSDVPDSYKNLIELCWCEDPDLRPTFEHITEVLKTDSGFIVDLVDEALFLDYIYLIEEAKSSFNDHCPRFHYKDFVIRKEKESDTNKIDSDSSKVTLYPLQLFEALSGQYQKLVIEAETDGQKQFIIGKKLIEGVSPFPQNTQLGIKYLNKSISNGLQEPLIYYSSMLIDSDIIPEDIEQARSLLTRESVSNDPDALVLLGKIEYKKGHFTEAKDYFIRASKQGNGESMHLYATMLMKGEGVEVNHDESLKYFTLAIKNGFKKDPPQLPTIGPSISKVEQEKKEKERRTSIERERKMSVETQHEMKICFVGSSKVRVQFLMVLNEKPFPERYVPSLYENYTQDIIIDGVQYKIHIWDSYITDEFAGLRHYSYAGANVFGVVFDVDDRYQFSRIETYWYEELKHYCKDAAIVLICICMEKRQPGNPDYVTEEEARELVNKLQLDGYIECFPKTGENMDMVFPTFINALASKRTNLKYFCNIA